MPCLNSHYLNSYSFSLLVQPVFHSPDNVPIQRIFLHFRNKEAVSKFCSPHTHCYSHRCVRQSGWSGTTGPGKSVLLVPYHLLMRLEMASRKTGSTVFLVTSIRLPVLKFPKSTLPFFSIAVMPAFFQS